MLTLYDVVFKSPILSRKGMPKSLEQLATKLVNSGRLRIDADERANFVRLNLPEIRLDFTFSNRELYDKKLLAEVKGLLLYVLKSRFGEEEAAAKLNLYMDDMRNRLSHKGKIAPDIEMKLARLVCQCNHPAVIRLLLLERAEIFISFSHNIGDMLNIEGWQRNGRNSGMQATGRAVNSVFISAGGDPFLTGENRRHTGDGDPAIARILIIGAQETGHFADMIRNKTGQPVSRHSADIYGQMAKPKVKAARTADKKRTGAHLAALRKIGLNRVVETERELKFFREKRKFSGKRFVTEAKAWLSYWLLKRRAAMQGFSYAGKLQKSKLPATQAYDMYRDMLFNIEPKADVYASENPDEEEAIACIEALARVPQQVIKWGHRTVINLWPGLYRVYYSEVIPEVERTLKR